MAKKVVTTREELDENDKPIDIQVEQPSAEESELMDYISSLGTSANLIKIHKIVEGRKAWCGDAEPGSVSEASILKKFGGGQYYLTAFMNGRFVVGGSRRLDIFEPPESLKAASNYQPSDGQSSPQILLLQEQINRQQDMILRMIEKNGSQQPNMLEMMRAMAEMQGNNKQPDISALLTPVLDLFGKSMELAKDSVAGSDSKMEWYKIISDAVTKLPAVLASLAPRMMKGASMPDATELTPEQAAQEMLKQGISWLKAKAIAGKDAELQVELILDNLDDPRFKNLALLLMNQPFESFGAVDPEIMKEPLRTWFKQVYDGLKEAIADENSSAVAGAGGLDTDVAGNEAADGGIDSKPKA
jgi:hypothetical protein